MSTGDHWLLSSSRPQWFVLDLTMQWMHTLLHCLSLYSTTVTELKAEHRYFVCLVWYFLVQARPTVVWFNYWRDSSEPGVIMKESYEINLHHPCIVRCWWGDIRRFLFLFLWKVSQSSMCSVLAWSLGNLSSVKSKEVQPVKTLLTALHWTENKILLWIIYLLFLVIKTHFCLSVRLAYYQCHSFCYWDKM